MKNIIKLLALVFIATIATSCATNNITKQVDVLKNYNYQVDSVSQMKLGGRSLDQMLSNQKDIVSALPGLAVSMLSKNLALEGNILMKVENPTSKVSNVNAFKYLIEINGKPFFEGQADRIAKIQQGEHVVVPLAFKANLFGVTDQNKGIEGVLSDILTKEGKGAIVLKVKPSVNVAGQSVFYPGYITVDSDLLNTIKKGLRSKL